MSDAAVADAQRRINLRIETLAANALVEHEHRVNLMSLHLRTRDHLAERIVAANLRWLGLRRIARALELPPVFFDYDAPADERWRVYDLEVSRTPAPHSLPE